MKNIYSFSSILIFLIFSPLQVCMMFMLMKLQSAFKVFYLDDGTIGGSAEDVIRD